MQRQQIIHVVAAVIERASGLDRELLVCQRAKGKRHAGLWEFPGGKLEPNESLRQAAERELREELSLEVQSVGRTLHSARDPGSPYVVQFVEVIASGAPQLSEHQALCWASPEKLARMNLAPSDRCFVEFLTKTPRAPLPTT
jgi:mutator protein MutT